MAPKQVSKKELTHNDVTKQLSLPKSSYEVIKKDFMGGHEAPLKVLCDGELYRVTCCIRKNGDPKPELRKGWLDLVRDKGFDDKCVITLTRLSKRIYRLELVERKED